MGGSKGGGGRITACPDPNAQLSCIISSNGCKKLLFLRIFHVGQTSPRGNHAGPRNGVSTPHWDLRRSAEVRPDDTLPARRNKESPYDGVIARATRKLALRATRLRVPVVNTWLNSPASHQLPGIFFDFEAVGRMRAEHLLTRGLSRFAAILARDLGHQRELQLSPSSW